MAGGRGTVRDREGNAMTQSTPGLAQAGLRLEIDDAHPAGAVATVILDRPHRRNAMTPSMWWGLAGIGASLPANVRVVVVRGEGPSFCAGLDPRPLTPEGGPCRDPLPDLTGPGFEAWITSCHEGFTWLRRPDFVTIAAGPRHPLGAGFPLALALDIPVLPHHAQLCLTEPAPA